MSDVVSAWECRVCGNIWIGPEGRPFYPPNRCWGDCGHTEFKLVYLGATEEEEDDVGIRR